MYVVAMVRMAGILWAALTESEEVPVEPPARVEEVEVGHFQLPARQGFLVAEAEVADQQPVPAELAELAISKSANFLRRLSMRAARIKNGVVADLWEVPALDSYASAGIELIAAPDDVGMGDSYANGIFTRAPVIPPTPAEITATTKAALATIDAKSIRSIREWIASQPTAPAFLKTHEADAIIERAKIT